MAKFIFGILCLFATTYAQAMTFQQRNDLEFKFGAIIKTAQNKYLPAQRVKDSLASAQGENLKVLKGIYADWPKSYSKDINYKNLGNGILFGYKGVPVFEFRVTSLNPYTIQVNGKYTVKFENGEGLAELNNILAKEGFARKGSKTSLFNFFIPDAVAAEDAVKTFKNSVIVTSNFGYDAANKKTQELVSKGFLIPDERMTTYWKRDPIACDGESAVGKIKDTAGNLFEFKTSRKDGFELKYKDMVVKSKSADANDYNCKSFSELPADLDTMTFDKLTGTDVGRQTRNNAVNKAVNQQLSEKTKQCISKEIKELIEIEKLNPDSRIARPNWDEKAYWEAVNNPRQNDQTVTMNGHIRNKCLYLKNKRIESEEGQAEMRAMREKAEADFDGHAGSSVSFAYADRIKDVVKTCEKIKKVRPSLDITCDSPKTVAEGKKLCAQVAQAGISAGHSVEVCFADKKCEPFTATHIFFDRQQAIFDTRIAYHEARAQFMKDYAKEISAKIVTENSDGSFDISSNNLDGSKLKQLKQALGNLGDLATTSPKYIPHNDKVPTLHDYISGAMGFLDCCYDVECKNSLAEKGIELKPTGDAKTVK